MEDFYESRWLGRPQPTELLHPMLAREILNPQALTILESRAFINAEFFYGRSRAHEATLHTALTPLEKLPVSLVDFYGSGTVNYQLVERAKFQPKGFGGFGPGDKLELHAYNSTKRGETVKLWNTGPCTFRVGEKVYVAPPSVANKESQVTINGTTFVLPSMLNGIEMYQLVAQETYKILGGGNEEFVNKEDIYHDWLLDYSKPFSSGGANATIGGGETTTTGAILRLIKAGYKAKQQCRAGGMTTLNAKTYSALEQIQLKDYAEHLELLLGEKPSNWRVLFDGGVFRYPEPIGKVVYSYGGSTGQFGEMLSGNIEPGYQMGVQLNWMFLKKLEPFTVVREQLQDLSREESTVETMLSTVTDYFKYVARGSYATVYGNDDYVVRYAHYRSERKSHQMEIKEEMTKTYPFSQGLVSPIAIYELQAERSSKKTSIHSFEVYVRLPDTLSTYANRHDRILSTKQKQQCWTNFMRNGCNALEYLHKHFTCVHGDISSANLFVANGVLMIGDWDLLLPLRSEVDYLLGNDSSTQLPVPVFAYIIKQRYLINSYHADIWALAVTLAHALFNKINFLDWIGAPQLPAGSSCEDADACKKIYPKHRNDCTGTARRLQSWMSKPQVSPGQIASRILEKYGNRAAPDKIKVDMLKRLRKALHEGKVEKMKMGDRNTITFYHGAKFVTLVDKNDKWECGDYQNWEGGQ